MKKESFTGHNNGILIWETLKQIDHHAQQCEQDLQRGFDSRQWKGFLIFIDFQVGEQVPCHMIYFVLAYVPEVKKALIRLV